MMEGPWSPKRFAKSTGRSREARPDLLARAQAGDVAALNELIAAHRHGVYRYGLRVCRTTEDAEDAVQETLWAATRSLGRFRGEASTLARWLFTIVRRECYRLLERHRREPEVLDLAEHDRTTPGAQLDELVLAAHRSAVLADALRDLDPVDREVILLRDVQELTAPEAADRLGISVDALKSRLHRARERLRTHVAARSA